MKHSRLVLNLALAAHLAALPACAQSSRTTQSGNSPPPLVHHEIKPPDLPPPKLENDVDNPPHVIPEPAGAKLNLPPGFEISTFAEGGFQRPRWMALAPNGDVFLGERRTTG